MLGFGEIADPDTVTEAPLDSTATYVPLEVIMIPLNTNPLPGPLGPLGAGAGAAIPISMSMPPTDGPLGAAPATETLKTT